MSEAPALGASAGNELIMEAVSSRLVSSGDAEATAAGWDWITDSSPMFGVCRLAKAAMLIATRNEFDIRCCDCGDS